jgi:aminoglycoside 3'-phosphotransferase III
MIKIIHILGASGAGTSTLGKALEQSHGFKWLETDDYFWLPTDPPFTKSRPREERAKLLRQDIEKYPKCIISGSLGMWGDEFNSQFDLVLWVDTPTDVRVERLHKREFERFGDRILRGGDMHTNHEEFIEWAKTYDTNSPPERCRTLHEEWISKVSCPVLRLDGSKLIPELMFEVEQTLLPLFPAELDAHLSSYTYTKDRIGCSSAGVFRYEHNSDVMYLKVAEVSDEIRRERDLMVWLKGKMPVPDVLYYGEQDGYAFLLMTKADGFMTCDCPRDAVGEQDKVHEPIAQTVNLLADALTMLQAVDIQDCPFENTLDLKLKSALYNIEHDLVDMDDFEDGNDFASPMELYKWLAENRLPEELCFTHGDFCLPNIFINGKAVTGFIDVGRGGIADKWQDIALCVRSLGYNLRHKEQQEYIDMLFTYLGIQPDEAKIRYYILLDELF